MNNAQNCKLNYAFEAHAFVNPVLNNQKQFPDKFSTPQM